MDDDTVRKELLLRLYDQLYNDINRHIMVVVSGCSSSCADGTRSLCR